MYAAVLPRDADLDAFRAVARQCLALGLAPREVTFVSPDDVSLFAALPAVDALLPISVPRAYAELSGDVICHAAPDRLALLYEALWRITHGERDLLMRAADKAVATLEGYAKAVRRDIHKMHAFLRFRARQLDGETVYTAWFEPQYFILRRAVPFFVDRFANMEWIIATPQGVAAWRGGALSYGPPLAKPETADDPVLDDVWLTYYRTTFNPARVRPKAMLAEMPKHYWRNMPETAAIPDMVAQAHGRVVAMELREADAPPLFATKVAGRAAPEAAIARTPLADLRAEASACRRCSLYAPATQAVFGEGPADAQLVFVGEQPGDQEDIAGRPFVGPAGELFDRALSEAGIVRSSVYVTNAVKHFKYVPRGKRRIHQKPNAGEVQACKWWLDRELAELAPKLVVALGATAAQALTGRAVAVLRARGPADFQGRRGFITVHPSFLLRLPEAERQREEFVRFVDDLVRVRTMLAAADVAA